MSRMYCILKQGPNLIFVQVGGQIKRQLVVGVMGQILILIHN
jgi:hypothetical protein